MNVVNPTLVCLHGYLGLPDDWVPVLGPANAQQIYPNLFRDFPIQAFDAWAETFNRWAAKHPSPKILVGYSLGGRLALHALRQDPKQWAGAILISTNLGLPSEELRALRLKTDLQWSERMRNDPWKEVMEKWNAQPVFKESGSFPPRKEEDFDRAALAEAMKKWSLGAQEDLQNTLFCLKMPLLWMIGAKDEKRLRFSHPSSACVQIADGGHRLLVDQPIKVREEMNQFLRNM